MYRLPAASTATPNGPLSCALVAAPPSPAYPGRSVARHGRNRPVGRDLAHHRGIAVRHEHVARRVHRDAHRETELRRGRRSAVSGISGAPVAREAGQRAARHPL